MAGRFSSNRIDIPSWTNISPVSISLWFYLNTVNNPERLLGSDDAWEIRITQGWTPGSNRLANELFSSNTFPPNPTCSTTVMSASTWYFAVCTATFNVSANIYLNGVLEATGTCVDTPTGTTFSIGNRNGSAAGEGTDGVIDDVRVYDRILTAEEVGTIYACRGVDNIINGLLYRWLMNEGAEGSIMSGSDSIKDIVGGKHGTPVGSPVYTGSFLKGRTMTRWQ